MTLSYNTSLKSIASSYIKLLNVNISAATVENDIEENPYYPSLLSLSETFKRYNIDNNAYEISAEDFIQLDPPFVALAILPGLGNDFVLVTEITTESVVYVHNNKKTIRAIRDFLKEYQGIIWEAEPGQSSGEKDLSRKQTVTGIAKIKVPLLIALAGLTLLLIIAVNLKGPEMFSFGLIFFLKMLGIITTIPLLMYKVKKNNVFLKNICSIGNLTNCEIVLYSKHSTLFGLVSWAELGFFYFASTTIFLLIAKIPFFTKVPFLAIANACAVPYIFFSIYWQYRIIKQWCTLCVLVQIILALEFIWSIIYFWHHFAVPHPDLLSFLLFLFAILAPMVIWYSIKDLLLRSNDQNKYEKAFKRLLYNPEVFSTLLKSQENIPDGWQHVGIDIGNPAAKTTLIKVCNPFCSYCAKSHSVLKNIIKNNKDIKVKIIFAVPTQDHKNSAAMVRHFLSLDTLNAQLALDEWYLSENRDLEAFTNKYPSTNGTVPVEPLMEQMKAWCERTGIKYTPTFFLNGHSLPLGYSIEDLEYVL